MAISYANSVLDAALAGITTSGSKIELLSTSAAAFDIGSDTPTSYATVVAASLGQADISYSAAQNGDVSGRKVVATPAEGTASATGTASAYAITNGTDTVYAIGDLTDQVVTSGNAFTIAAFDIEFTDPTAG
jgi:hypothetical protein